MGVIAFRISDELEMELRQIALSKNKKISSYCKEIITQNITNEVFRLNWREDIESRIKKLEEKVKELEEPKLGRLGL